MKLYRQKPITIEAEELTSENVDDLAKWCGGVQVKEFDSVNQITLVGLNVPTLQGVIRASEGDFVVRCMNGAFKVKQPNEFHSQFEPI